MNDAASALAAARSTDRISLADAAKTFGWGMAFWAGEQLAASAFERNMIAMVAVQAAVAEWGAGRMGIAWTDASSRDAAPAAVRKRFAISRRIAIGTALGFVCAAAAVGIAVAVRAAVVARGEPSAGLLLVGLGVAALGAVRDELLLRGVVVRATRRLLPVWATLVVCGFAAASARLGIEGRLTAGLGLEALRGVALGALWVRDRGAWMPCSANAAWAWATGPLTCGGLFDVRFGSGTAIGPWSFAVLAPAAIASSLWAIQACCEQRPRT